MRGSVFKIAFGILAGEFESIETSPGFAQLLVKNLSFTDNSLAIQH